MTTNDKYIVLEEKKYTLNDEPIDNITDDFLIPNKETLTKKELNMIAKMKEGETLSFGGGAAGFFELKRVS